MKMKQKIMDSGGTLRRPLGPISYGISSLARRETALYNYLTLERKVDRYVASAKCATWFTKKVGVLVEGRAKVRGEVER